MGRNVTRKNGRPGRDGKTVNAGVYLSADIHERLMAKAKETGTSASSIIRMSLETALAASAAPDGPED